MQFIDIQAQYARYREAIDSRIRRVLDEGRFIMGPEVGELEQALAAYVGGGHCLSVSSGTAALEIALRALDIGSDDEVITVPFTWISSAEVISLVGATPVFVDILPQDFNLNPQLVEAAITERTKAIIAVNLFGQMANYQALNEIAEKHDLTVIEDAAQSFGATQKAAGGSTVKSGRATRVGCTSFFPAKPLGCFGDGGAIFTNDGELNEKMRAIRTHGGVKRHEHHYVGTNGRMDTLQAAVVLAKLPFFDEEVAAREAVAERYRIGLSEVCGVPQVVTGNTHVYAQYTLRLEERDSVQGYFKEQGVPCGVYYPKCLHEQPVFSHCRGRFGDFPESERASRQVLSLPMHPFLSEADQDKVIATVKGGLA